MDFEALQKEAHAITREKGWYDTGRSFSSFIADIHETLSEAKKAYRKHGFDSGIVAPEASVTPNGIVAGGQLIPDGTPVYVGRVPEARPFGVLKSSGFRWYLRITTRVLRPGTESWDGCSNSYKRRPSNTASTWTRPLPPGWSTCAGDQHHSPAIHPETAALTPAGRRLRQKGFTDQPVHPPPSGGATNSQENPGRRNAGVFSCPREPGEHGKPAREKRN